MAIGLRERKKLATRASLAAAALKLAAEHGPDRVTVEDIAAAADVSPRTFFNHFASKEEAFVAEDLDSAQAFIKLVKQQPLDASPWGLVTGLLGDHLEASALPRNEARALAAVRTSPAVLAQQHLQYASLESELIAEIALRLPAGSSPLQPRLLAGTVVAALKAAVTTWIEDDQDSTARQLFDDAVVQLSPAFSA